MTSTAPLRIAVIGARCRRQGIGAHLARFCAQAGAQVVGVLGTSPATAAEAADLLRESTGQAAQPHVEWDALLADSRPEAVVVAGPHETHADYLRRAFEARLHVLCEKPLVWDPPEAGLTDMQGRFSAVKAEALATLFLHAGLHLRVNAQWPYTLPTYARLCPDPCAAVPQTFVMRMSPGSTGIDMLLDALPHPLSMLATVLPDPAADVEDVAVQFADEGRHADVAFTYRSGGVAIAAEVAMQQCPDQPRPAGFGFDGHFVHRHVALPGYELCLESASQTIPLPDPTPLLVRSFLAAVAAGPPQDSDRAAVPGLRHLAQIVAAAPDRAP